MAIRPRKMKSLPVSRYGGMPVHRVWRYASIPRARKRKRKRWHHAWEPSRSVTWRGTPANRCSGWRRAGRARESEERPTHSSQESILAGTPAQWYTGTENISW